MKKKTVYGLIALLAVFFMSVPLTSCSDDEPFDAVTPDPNDPAMGDVHDTKLTGSWERTTTLEETGGEYHSYNCLTFNSNGTWESYEDYWDEEYPDGDHYWERGHWSTDDSTLYWNTTNCSDKDEIGSTDTETYRISGDKLYLGYEVYTRKK